MAICMQRFAKLESIRPFTPAAHVHTMKFCRGRSSMRDWAGLLWNANTNARMKLINCSLPFRQSMHSLWSLSDHLARRSTAGARAVESFRHRNSTIVVGVIYYRDKPRGDNHAERELTQS